MDEVATKAKNVFDGHGVKLTMGGEPTYIPINPEGAEWSYAAVGPTKLKYAWKVARAIQKKRLPGSAAFYCPGKSYPGEVNPRWAIRLLANKDGTPLFRTPARAKTSPSNPLPELGRIICQQLKVTNHWLRLSDPTDPMAIILALPLDHDGDAWHTMAWPLPKAKRFITSAEGPAGLRLPLHLFPENFPRRVLTLEWRRGIASVFFLPLLQRPFLELLSAVEKAIQALKISGIELQGYTPQDEGSRWTQVGVTADPGVLEINLPACTDWREYAEWMDIVTTCCESSGLRSWKESPWDYPAGTGGGNHLLWGGPSLLEHPFFTRPQWLAAILRYWQLHPALAYFFTGCYVGSSSQAPRPDESARDLYDLEMAYRFLDELPEGDHRSLINETLRHLHTDITGNAHRSEISFDKFWNVSWPGGMLGLIEFRALESLPRADWMSSIALLWTAIAAHLLDARPPRGLKRLGRKLNDQFFLPTCLWKDLTEIFDELDKSGFHLDRKIYEEIRDWRFPALLQWKKGDARLTVRRAHEGWPLLCETPIEGGTTSRFVDTSMQRLEFCGNAELAKHYSIHIEGRLLELHEHSDSEFIAGLRYRRTNLHPSLHPGIAPQLPLHVALVDNKSGLIAARYVMNHHDKAFHPTPATKTARLVANPCRSEQRGDLTCDLRLP